MKWEELRPLIAKDFCDSRLVRDFRTDDILKITSDSQKLFLGPIDWTWGSDQDIQNNLGAVITQYDYRCNQVETLIHEAGALIERSLGDLLKFDELAVDRFKVFMEFVEADRMYSQQLAEQKDDAFWSGLATEADKASLARAAQCGPIDPKTKAYMIQQSYGNSVKEYVNAGNSAGDKDVVTRANARGAANSAVAAQLQSGAQISSNQLDGASHSARKQYETQSRIHQIERREINREIMEIKLLEFIRPGGALNYSQRMIEIGLRAYTDFVEVLSRLHAIVLGLREFYSVEDPSEAELEDDLKPANSRSRILGAVRWLRKAANAFARARMDEQDYVIRLMVTGPNLFRDLSGPGREVTFSADQVADMTKAQLRGISATAEPLVGDAWIDLEVICPRQQLKKVDIILPPLVSRLGRVSSSGSLNVRDAGGGRPIVNRSPVGDWKLKIVGHDPRAEKIERLHLDFHLVTG
jgi:hypothetical protein